MAEQPQGPLFTGLSYVFSHDGGQVAAHCLDLDLVASGGSIEEAEESLNALVLIQIARSFRSGNWAQLMFRAPDEYWKALDHAKALPSCRLEVEVPPMLLPVDRYSATLPVSRFEMEAVAA